MTVALRGESLARGAVTIQAQVTAGQRVRVDVFDLLGRRVATLPDAHAPSGRLALPLDAAALRPGVYVVRLAHGSAVQTARLVVQR